MEFLEATKILRTYFGSHSRVARHLGITPEHYTSLRTGKVNLPKRTSELIILKAREVEAQSHCPQEVDA